jgi:hypothetical protein
MWLGFGDHVALLSLFLLSSEQYFYSKQTNFARNIILCRLQQNNPIIQLTLTFEEKRIGCFRTRQHVREIKLVLSCRFLPSPDSKHHIPSSNPAPPLQNSMFSLEKRGFRGDSGDSQDDSPRGKAAHKTTQHLQAWTCMDRQESQSNWPEMRKTLGKPGFLSGEDRIRTFSCFSNVLKTVREVLVCSPRNGPYGMRV